MIIGKTIYVVDSHTAGMPTRIILGGIPNLSGNTITQKAGYFADNFDYIRTALFQEPRGLLRGVGALITPPTRSEAQLGVFYMDSTYRLIPMCGHGSIGVITAAIEFGMLEEVKPITTVVLDTPAGLVTGHAVVKGGSVISVSVQNVPSFVYTSAVLDVPEIGNVPVDVAFGGTFLVLVDADDIGVNIEKRNAPQLSRLAMVVKEVANSQIRVKHPQKPISTIDAVRFFHKSAGAKMHIKNIVVFAKGDKGIDRSPCGTGTSAQLAALYAKGQIKVNQKSIHESIIGTTFTGKVTGRTKVNGFDAIIPEITGSAYTTGIHTFVLSPHDPLGHGFLIE
jgi:proline racemase/trans-L-3-hydroxyproline dehydratase